MNPTHPLISCICITHNRSIQLQNSIECFEAQNYPNKELVISYPITDIITKKIVDKLLQNEVYQIKQIERTEDESLGNARNNAIRKCLGDYICIWDDDDWYHPSRLSFQFNSMQIIGQGFQASVLSRILLYNATTNKAYLSFSYTWDGTILCRKEILLQNQYANRDHGEDTHVITFLSGKKLLYEINDSPFLYVYIYHGTNTWNSLHFEHFQDKSEELSIDVTEDIRKMINY